MGESIESCKFCRIIAGELPAVIVHESPQAISFFPDKPVTLGHTLVVPRDHVADILTLSDEAADAVLMESRHVGRAIMRALSPDGLNLISSVGEAASQSVFHLHMHLVPRWYGDAFGDFWPKSPEWSDNDKRAAAKQIRLAAQGSQ